MTHDRGPEPMVRDDEQLAEVVGRERARLRRFIDRRVRDSQDAENIVQDVFRKLVEANRLLMPIDHVTGWLFQVARNAIVDFFRKRTRERIDLDADGDLVPLEDLLPAADDGPEALYARQVLLDEIAVAIDELPADQRAVFVAHELEGRSFRELAAETGVSVNTLLSRKHYAVRRLRHRLQCFYDELTNR